jgi:transglutaminase-like putative cysteine protease
MKKEIIIFLSVISSIIMHPKMYAQQYKYKKVSKELLQKKSCEIYAEADAMITNKTGLWEINYKESDGYRAELTQQIQVKIFNTEGDDISIIEIFYYSPRSSRNQVKIANIKGRTYNLEHNKIIETKLTDENITIEQYDDYFKKATFVMPNVQSGSVFEYEYMLISDFFENIDDWFIQEDIPVIYNKFTTKIPEYFTYQMSVLGPFAATSDKSSTLAKSIEYKIRDEGNGYLGTQVASRTYQINYEERTIVHENIPAFKSEPYAANANDFKGRITHQLISLAYPDSPIQTFAETYEELNAELLKSETFGKKVINGKFIDKLITIENSDNQIDKAIKIHQYFLENVSFNGLNSYTTTKSGDQLFADGKGDAGEINLNYIAALNHAGIPTSPVILSTRGNGSLHPVMPDYSQFNYIVALSEIDGNEVLSDATSTIPYGNLPVKCLQDKAWVISKADQGWINLKENCVGKQIVQTDITQTKENVLYVSKINKQNYLAFDDVVNIVSNGDEEYLYSIDVEKDLVLDSLYIADMTNDLLKLKQVQKKEIINQDVIYVKPFVHLPFENNPFKEKVRQTNVDFPFAMEYKFVTNIKILDGYEYEVPGNLNAVMEENDLILKYSSSYLPSIKTLNIVADFKILQTEFLPADYEKLKISMELMINKLHEPVILRKM